MKIFNLVTLETSVKMKIEWKSVFYEVLLRGCVILYPSTYTQSKIVSRCKYEYPYSALLDIIKFFDKINIVSLCVFGIINITHAI